MRDERIHAAALRWLTYYDNPVAFAFDNFGFQATDYQAEVMRDVAAGHDVTWRSGHGCGKTATLAMLVFWFLCTRRSKIPTTAPTFRQVKHVLWAEIAYWHQRFKFRHQLELLTTQMRMRGHEASWFAVGLSSNKPSNFEGFHATSDGSILFLIDEGKGVQDPIYDAADGALTAGGQRLYTSTPGSRRGRFYESHMGKLARFFHAHHTNGETSSRVDPKWVAQKRLEWGIESSIYLAKVRGEFPQEGDDVLIPLSFLDAALEAFDAEDEHGEPAIPVGAHPAIGVDVARHGLNETVAMGGSVSCLAWLRVVPKGELYTQANWLRTAFRDAEAERIGVDDTGVGGGITSHLRETGTPVFPVNFGERSSQPIYYANLKTECAFALRSALAENFRARQAGKVGTFAVLKHDKLWGQLCNLRVRAAGISGSGAVRILDPDDPSIDKSEIPDGLRISPDHAHAAMICYHTARVGVAAAAGQVRHAPLVKARERPGRTGYLFDRTRSTGDRREGRRR